MRTTYFISSFSALLALGTALAMAEDASQTYRYDQPNIVAEHGRSDDHEDFDRGAIYAKIREESPGWMNHEEKRDLPSEPWYGIYECEKLGWTGKCQWRQTVPVGQSGIKNPGPCFNRLWNSPQGSVGIDKGIYCTGFLDTDCRGLSRTCDSNFDMKSYNAPEFKNPQSFRCWKPKFSDPDFEVDWDKTTNPFKGLPG